MNPQYPMLSLIFCSLIGAYVVWFSRRAYSKPDWYISNWQSWLPRKPWSQKAVKALAVFCTWAGLLILTEPLVAFTPLSAFRGPKLAVTMGITLAFVTASRHLAERVSICQTAVLPIKRCDTRATELSERTWLARLFT